ncbi:hypothetical protein CPB86DRAFT_760566 [Serendipita vermifera]|nr:hypothetical protein CPB86DRAFT_760566 [Serendipita vermifera]
MNELQVFIVHEEFGLMDEVSHQLAQSLVDQETRRRACRFFHREDSWRFLVGRLLRHLVIKRILTDEGQMCPNLDFRETETGKPYLHSPTPTPSIGFNISHDHNLVSLAVRRDSDISTARNIGIDIMLARVPEKETFSSFLESVSIAFTLREQEYLRSRSRDPRTIQEAVVSLFQLWTVKEAYVKALGLGLGYDLCRLEYLPRIFDRLLVDGAPLIGWDLKTFQFNGSSGGQLQEYVGAVCYQLTVEGAHPESASPSIMTRDLPPLFLQTIEVLDILREVQTLIQTDTHP